MKLLEQRKILHGHRHDARRFRLFLIIGKQHHIDKALFDFSKAEAAQRRQHLRIHGRKTEINGKAGKAAGDIPVNLRNCTAVSRFHIEYIEGQITFCIIPVIRDQAFADTLFLIHQDFAATAGGIPLQNLRKVFSGLDAVRIDGKGRLLRILRQGVCIRQTVFHFFRPHFSQHGSLSFSPEYYFPVLMRFCFFFSIRCRIPAVAIMMTPLSTNRKPTGIR